MQQRTIQQILDTMDAEMLPERMPETVRVAQGTLAIPSKLFAFSEGSHLINIHPGRVVLFIKTSGRLCKRS